MLSVSKLGEKVSILVDRFFNPSTTVSTPVTSRQTNISSPPSVPPQILPPGLNTSNPMATPEPDFNTMFSGPDNPLQNAKEPFEPMPSNFGGSIF